MSIALLVGAVALMLPGCEAVESQRNVRKTIEGQDPGVVVNTPEPEGSRRLLPIDGIPAIFEPEFVSAEEANMPDDADVIGVVIKGIAHAYSINLLDSHEIVNDEIAGVKFAATW